MQILTKLSNNVLHLTCYARRWAGVFIITCVNYPSGIFANPKSVDNMSIYGKIEPILEVALLAR